MDSIKLSEPITSLNVYGLDKLRNIGMGTDWKVGKENIQDICFDIDNNKFIFFTIAEMPILEGLAEIRFGVRRGGWFNLFPGYICNNNLHILNGYGLRPLYSGFPNSIDISSLNIEIDIPYMFSSNFMHCLDEKEINCSYIINYIPKIKSELKKFYINKLKEVFYEKSYIKIPNNIKSLMYGMIYEMECQRETSTGFGF